MGSLFLFIAGLILAAALLIRFAMDFSAQMHAPLSALFWLLAGASLTVGGANVFRMFKGEPPLPANKISRAILVAAIPLGFLASSLDCTGLSLEGCSSFCAFVKLVWIPLMSVACAAYMFTEKTWLLTAIAAMAFVPLFPHCVCYNVGNEWWIDRLGASPVCYGWGFVTTVISVSALRAGAWLWPSLAVTGAIIAGATAFFISHHYFHFPW